MRFKTLNKICCNVMLRVAINFKVSTYAVRCALLARVQQGVRLYVQYIFVVTCVSVLAVNVDPSEVYLRNSSKVCYDRERGIKIAAGDPLQDLIKKPTAYSCQSCSTSHSCMVTSDAPIPVLTNRSNIDTFR